MPTDINSLGQPIGSPLKVHLPRPPVAPVHLTGRSTKVRPLDAKAHGPDLFSAFSKDAAGKGWTYLPLGPFKNQDTFTDWLTTTQAGTDPIFHAILTPKGKALGFASYLRINSQDGLVEVGFIHFSPDLQGTIMATEAMYLMMAHVFDDLGYRRYEWKCDALNAPSRAAAARLGFTYEGTFRQATHYKGRNRDTAWFSVIDSEWPARKAEFQRWLNPANFNETGRQRSKLRHD
ncbi:MAG: GNAT family protein [Pseudomonadota bacterium]